MPPDWNMVKLNEAFPPRLPKQRCGTFTTIVLRVPVWRANV